MQVVHAVQKNVVVVDTAAAAVVVVVSIGVEWGSQTGSVLAGSNTKVPVAHMSVLYVVMNYTEDGGKPVVVGGYYITNFQQAGCTVEVAVAAAAERR